MHENKAKAKTLPRNRASEGTAAGAFPATLAGREATQAPLVTFQSSLNLTPKKTQTPKKQLTAIQMGK
jgi:hypothetical protein